MAKSALKETASPNGHARAARIKREAMVYEKDNPHGPQYFRDLFHANVKHEHDALDRLQRHQRQFDFESRAAGLEQRVVDTALGFGGEFSPPWWTLSDPFVRLASRAGRTFADLLQPRVLPPGIASVHVPKFATGSSDTVQPAQDTPEAEVPPTSSDVGQDQVVTIAGDVVVSQQLLDLSPLGFDHWVYKDLHSDYNAQLENQLINGTGINGQILGLASFSIPAANTISGSGGSSIATVWPLLGQAIAAVGNGRLLQPEVCLMAPRRWAWIASSIDSQNRPIDTPRNPTISDYGAAGGYPAIGLIDGIPTYLSGAITAGTSADNVYFVRPSDMLLWESTERFDVMPNPVSGTLEVRVALRRYCAFAGNVYNSGLSVVSGLPKPSSF
jgi:hypothetical protein